MHIQVKAIGTELTESAKVYVDEKVSKLRKFLTPHQDEAAVADVHLMYAPAHTEATKDECHITVSGLGKGNTFHVETAEPDMHVAIDAAVQTLEEQLRRFKEKVRDHITEANTEAKQLPVENLMATEPIEDVDESDEIDPALRPDDQDR